MHSNEKIARLQKISRVTFVLLTVLQVLLVLAALSVILAGIFYGEDFAGKLNLLFSAMAQDVLTAGTLTVLILCVVAKLALYFAVLTLAGRMFRDFSREASPFRQLHVRRDALDRPADLHRVLYQPIQYADHQLDRGSADLVCVHCL